MTPVLSILIITHNQRDLLKRCFTSVIGQELTIPFEIIISDDRSSDGTEELISKFKQQYEGNKEYLISIKYSRCNSNDCDPLTVSERCGWNKLNAYKQSEGKFFVNIDADDYLRSKDIYQKQIDMLETHPDCSMCMQRAVSLKEGESFDKGISWPVHPSLINEAVISAEEFIMKDLRGLNQTYMIRRRPENEMEVLYGKYYDDTVITYHHLQYGPVVFLDRADYVWMQYPSSISHNMTSDDVAIQNGLLHLHHVKMIPKFKYLFLNAALKDMIHMFKVVPRYPSRSSQYKEYHRNQKGFIYKYYSEEHHSLFSTIRYKFARYWLLIMSKYGLKSPFFWSIANNIIL